MLHLGRFPFDQTFRFQVAKNLGAEWNSIIFWLLLLCGSSGRPREAYPTFYSGKFHLIPHQEFPEFSVEWKHHKSLNYHSVAIKTNDL